MVHYFFYIYLITASYWMNLYKLTIVLCVVQKFPFKLYFIDVGKFKILNTYPLLRVVFF